MIFQAGQYRGPTALERSSGECTMKQAVITLAVARKGMIEPVLFGIIGIMLIVVVAAPVIMYVRRRCMRGRAGEAAGRLKMEDAEQLHRTGQVSDEEFQRLRLSILGLDAKIPEKDDSPSSPPPANDDERYVEDDS